MFSNLRQILGSFKNKSFYYIVTNIAYKCERELKMLVLRNKYQKQYL